MTKTKPAMSEASENPSVYDGPAAWTAAEMRANEDWIVPLDSSDIAELKSAVAATRDVPLVSLTRDDFTLPLFGPKLQDIQREVVNGRGFVLIRGLPVTDFDREGGGRSMSCSLALSRPRAAMRFNRSSACMTL